MGYWNTNNTNNWITSSTAQLLNSGDYYNRKGTYSSNGLTEEAKALIADAKWYIGAVSSYSVYPSTTPYGLASNFYNYERGTYAISGGSKSWIGKVGLMYPSDYGYATGNDTRAKCLTIELDSWNKDTSRYVECINNDWLNSNASHQWTITPFTGFTNYAIYINYGHLSNSHVYYANSQYIPHEIRPTVYLKADITITGGTGTITDPYEIK